ncbi:MAG: bifunctional 2-polyprenyl-6-hydroxyphenol methylase/3-demethylubiquinol 3-O-methyltransferase UbiG [Alphaproteobacteria bacterium]|nr:bifunctional 2-polyprenyl-6-hydroxyphenol methylase/3-demethylubiquinol 3-O-methyltransferase UbiG [Alphaproteobacteria bacterium]
MPDAAASVTIDPDEVAKFSAIAEQWWDPAGKFAPLHAINPLRIAFIREQLACDASPPLTGLSLLDIGCGGGLLCEPMRRLGAEVTGIDASEKNIRTAAAHAAAQELAITYRHSSAEALAAEGRSYDIVLNMEVVEHVADLEAFIAASCALVKPGGLMFCSTLNRTAKAYALAIIGAEYLLRWLPKGTHDWSKFVRPSEMEALLRRHGMRITALTGMTYRPLSGEWRLAPHDLSVNYLLCAGK